MIRVENLVKDYGDVRAVNEINFTVKNGTILGFLGPNGAGKTTTMKIITCYLQPTEGNVFVDDLNVYEHSLEIRKKIGYLPETAPLYENMNVIDFLNFVSEIRQIPKHKKSKSLRDIIELTGLGDVIFKDIHELSKGYHQRVGLAQAMIHDPEILILDEPTSGLDPNQIIDFRNLIKEIGKSKTIILSTHILSQVEATCDEVIIINKGVIAANNSMKELLTAFEGRTAIEAEIKSSQNKDEVFNKLQMIPGVNGILTVENRGSDSNLFKLEAELNQNIQESIYDKSVLENWKILSLREVNNDLEDVFRKLTKTSN